MARKIRVAITSGDPDGIGLEIAAKALKHFGPQPNVQFFLWRSSSCPRQFLKDIDTRFKRVTHNCASIAEFDHNILIDIASDSEAPFWVEEAGQLCLQKKMNCLVTGPLSKTLIKSVGLNDIGHTEILQRISQTKPIFMTFLGEHFNVLLASGHQPLSQVAQSLSLERLTQAISLAHQLKLNLSEEISSLPLGLVGLNPHAGEEGLLGTEEQSLFVPAIKAARQLRIEIEGPLIPDSCFQKRNWKKYAFFICPYHDQGLIPFKMIHGQDSGVQLSLGLPFIRTSVDHGTAKDLFLKNQANPNSMIDAIRQAIILTNNLQKETSE